ncbi:uncharacterized protein BYT42DRAFT_558465 [Radiomyces spectabilis]|uniref:uncharacterized protein n=1 Tax=Radiomyces spectabilis TaxID=64574 RepID=UPI00221FDB78|nr:uncharacterized protein BYT42DRAFT_558465 [Radiomyces spectabilis]KAI8387977.1 hypothetical protein BYT42DRAFT_558465 [Radiomyces spectabilis]
MSFANMLSGAECSSGANPMAQMLKQFNQDRSLQRDRFGSPEQGSASTQSIRTEQRGPMAGRDHALVNEFFGQEQRPMGRPDTAGSLGTPFEFSELHHELDALRHHPPAHGTAGSWTNEFDTMHQQGGARLWEISPEEEAAMEKVFQESRMAAGSTQNVHAWHDEFMNHPEVANMDPRQLTEFENAFQKYFDWANEFDLYQDKGKGKSAAVDLNASWEEQFAAHEAKEETEEDIAKKVEEAAASQDPLAFEQFESIWQDIRDQMGGGGTEDTDNWEDEFGQFVNTNPTYKPDLGDYVFEIDNPYLERANSYAEGLAMMEQNGSLNEIALALEATVQKDPNNAEAWMHLGNIQAQNEKEEPAIRALEKAVSLDPGNLTALMSLAVSYTNESYDQAAYQTLERWITEKYPSLAKTQSASSTATPFELHDRVTEMFLTAARQAPEGQLMDPDVQVGLGVLFYGGGELDKAIDCFASALKGRPNDFLLWNRLGATLANNGRSEDAIDAYHKALELCPSFVRARYNLGVSCINIGCHREAAEHLLTGLSMHKRGLENAEEGVNVSSNLWEMLRKTFMMMNRRDLADKAIPGADINQFRNEFEF